MVIQAARVARARLPAGDRGALVAVPIAIAVGALAARDAVPTLLVTAVAGVVITLMLRVELAALVLVAVEPFETYLKSVGGSGVKLLGAFVFAAWLLRILARAGSLRLDHPAVRAAAVLFAVLLASTVVHPNTSDSQVLVRYLSYLGVFVVLVDCARNLLPARRIVAVYVASCTAAAVVGLVLFAGSQLRAGGPVGDPNDFAFFLLSAVPLALGLRGRSRRPWVYAAAALVMSAALLATLSRGALVAAALAFGYALLAGVLRPRTTLVVLAVVAAISAVVAVGFSARIATSLSAKDKVAQQNVDDRLTLWRVAAEMTADNPVLGLGPGGFRDNRDRYLDYEVFDPTRQLDVAHETYLETSAELGLPGLAAFVALLGFGFAGARRAASRAGPDRQLALGVTVALIGTAVAAAFLTEQFFLPLWLLAALGAALDPGPPSTTEGTFS